MAASVKGYTIRVNEPKVHLVSAKAGYNHVRKVTQYVQRTARIGASRGPYSHTKKLAASIVSAGPFLSGLIIHTFVGTALSYAPSVERGAKIHPIFPKNTRQVWRFGSRKRPQLKFIWRGRIVYTPHVPMSPTTIGRSHPGQRGKWFLRNAMIKAAAKYNMIFIPGPMSIG